jgi:hypothetical protein
LKGRGGLKVSHVNLHVPKSRQSVTTFRNESDWLTLRVVSSRECALRHRCQEGHQVLDV